MLFSELYKILVNKVTFVGFRGAIAAISPLDPPLYRSIIKTSQRFVSEVYREYYLFWTLLTSNNGSFTLLGKVGKSRF